jgi:hypothetical protein
MVTEWQHDDVVIALGFARTSTVHGHLSDRQDEEAGRRLVREQYAQVVGAYLRGAAEAGWQPAESADFDSASRGGRLRVRTTISKESTTFGLGEVRATTITHLYESVSIRLRRPMEQRAEPEAPSS